MNLAQKLRAYGLRIHEVSGWETRRRPYNFEPKGVMVHHTAGTNSLNICVNGRSGLPGPLCQFLIHKNGTIYLISQGYSNHAGKGYSGVLHDVMADKAPKGDASQMGYTDNFGGNSHFWGIEVENLGNGSDPYPDVQIDALVKLCAALCDMHGWSHNRVIHHREWTRRKIDMSWRGDIRGAVQRILAGGTYTQEGDIMMKRGDNGPKVAELQRQVNRVLYGHHDPERSNDPEAALKVDGDFGELTENAVKDVEGYQGWPQTGVVDAMFLARCVHIVTYRDIIRKVNEVKTQAGEPGPQGPPGAPGPKPKTLVVTEWE